MSNLIKNIFKTLLFFDLIVIIDHYFLNFKNSNPALKVLINESAVLALVLAFTLFFICIVEKKKITIPFREEPFEKVKAGGTCGLFVAFLGVAVFVLLDKMEFLGLNKPTKIYYYIPALLINAVASELLLRGYLFSLYKKHYTFLGATGITTALFIALKTDLYPKNLLLLLNLALLNILLCFIYEFTNSFITVVSARFSYTLISVFALGSLKLENDYPVWLKIEGIALENSRVFTLLLCLILLFFLCQKYALHVIVIYYTPIIIKKIRNFDLRAFLNNLKLKLIAFKNDLPYKLKKFKEDIPLLLKKAKDNFLLKLKELKNKIFKQKRK